MKKTIVIVLLAVLFSGCAGVEVKKVQVSNKRWNYISGSILTKESTEKLIIQLKLSSEAGCTQVLWSGCRGFRIPELNIEQRASAGRVQEEAKKLGVKIIPGIVSIGYSGRYFHADPNLSAGLPVQNMGFIVKDKKALPDPADALDGALLKKDGGVLAAVYKVKPFSYYTVSFIVNKEVAGEEKEGFVSVSSSNGKRHNCRTNPEFRKREDGRFAGLTVFNTLEGDEISVKINCKNSDVTDVRIEPAGFSYILRRDNLPLTVKSAESGVVYEEGKDFLRVLDPILQVKPFPGDFPLYHDVPVLTLTKDSRIKEGEKLLASFWHHITIYDEQHLVTLENQRTWEIFEQEIKETVKLWPCEGYMLNYDEIRVAGWEPGDLKGTTAGQMLAAHFKRMYNLVKKYAPQAEVYTWSDMFTPYHNAYPFEPKGYYYLVNGNWDGSWEGVPSDVIIFNWYSPGDKGVKFFEQRGNRQIICGYYDGRTEEKMKKNIAGWKKVSEGVSGIDGYMYTTWGKDYSNLNKYFELLDTFDSWSGK